MRNGESDWSEWFVLIGYAVFAHKLSLNLRGTRIMEYRIDDKTLNITAYDGKRLVGCLRILSDGYFFGTITELLVLPEYQKQGIGSRLLQLAKENTPTMLYFGSQPGMEAFYEKNGCQKSLQSYVIEKK